jgi:hypothetical protein
LAGHFSLSRKYRLPHPPSFEEPALVVFCMIQAQKSKTRAVKPGFEIYGRKSKLRLFCVAQTAIQPRILRDTPRFAAITLVAPGERFNALDILFTPTLAFAIVFNVRTSSFDHARRTSFFVFLAIIAPLCEPPSYHPQLI